MAQHAFPAPVARTPRQVVPRPAAHGTLQRVTARCRIPAVHPVLVHQANTGMARRARATLCHPAVVLVPAGNIGMVRLVSRPLPRTPLPVPILLRPLVAVPLVPPTNIGMAQHA